MQTKRTAILAAAMLAATTIGDYNEVLDGRTV